MSPSQIESPSLEGRWQVLRLAKRCLSNSILRIYDEKLANRLQVRNGVSFAKFSSNLLDFFKTAVSNVEKKPFFHIEKIGEAESLRRREFCLQIESDLFYDAFPPSFFRAQ